MLTNDATNKNIVVNATQTQGNWQTNNNSATLNIAGKNVNAVTKNGHWTITANTTNNSVDITN